MEGIMNLHIARTAIQSKPPKQSMVYTLVEIVAMFIAASLLLLWV